MSLPRYPLFRVIVNWVDCIEICGALKGRVFISLILLLTPLRAQQSGPLIRSNSRLVLLDVVVTDKTGLPIRGLTKDDFTVFENGQPQKIASFEAVSTESSGTGQGDGSRTIILLDQLNIAYPDLAYARDRVVMFLNANPVEKQPTALMAIGPRGLTMVEDFTRNSQHLKDKLAHLAPVDVNSKGGGTDTEWAQEHAQAALRALTQIARAAIGSPYSLNVIWVTSGFAGLLQTPGSNDGVESGLHSVANMLIRSRMRLYTIDPAGVVPIDFTSQKAKITRGSIRDGHESAAEQLQGSTHGEQMSADELLSHMTAIMGGLSYFGRNDVEIALSQAILDGASAYVISYSPANMNFAGEYRKIEVHTTLPDATARTRKGYYAVPDEAAADQGMKDALWEAAMSSPLIYAGLDVSCPATYDASKDRLTGKLVVKPQQLTEGTNQREQVIRVASFSKDRKLLNSWLWRITWKTPWTNRVVSASFDKVLSPKTRTVRFLVSDPAAERMGTCEYPLP
jgi:VWFA-related protein